jgi:hypothetical protein
MRPVSEPQDASLRSTQISNAAAKSDRLAVMVQAALYSDLKPSFGLAEAVFAPNLERFYDAVRPALGATERAEAAPATAYALQSADAARPTLASVSSTPVELEATPLPPRKPKLPPPPPSALLDDTQIAGIKSRLRLTPEQSEYWPAVETALRDVARVHFRPAAMRGKGPPNLDVNSPEVQKLIWAAMPLLRQLREDQKREVRQLVRVIGLHTVAAHI